MNVLQRAGKIIRISLPIFQYGGRKPEESEKSGTETDIGAFQRLYRCT
jgi:hypothetical protein